MNYSDKNPACNWCIKGDKKHERNQSRVLLGTKPSITTAVLFPPFSPCFTIESIILSFKAKYKPVEISQIPVPHRVAKKQKTQTSKKLVLEEDKPSVSYMVVGTSGE